MKSAYFLARFEKNGDVSESSSESIMKRFWKIMIWKAKIPKRIRNFAWRACQKMTRFVKVCGLDLKSNHTCVVSLQKGIGNMDQRELG